MYKHIEIQNKWIRDFPYWKQEEMFGCFLVNDTANFSHKIQSRRCRENIVEYLSVCVARVNRHHDFINISTSLNI